MLWNWNGKQRRQDGLQPQINRIARTTDPWTDHCGSILLRPPIPTLRLGGLEASYSTIAAPLLRRAAKVEIVLVRSSLPPREFVPSLHAPTYRPWRSVRLTEVDSRSSTPQLSVTTRHRTLRCFRARPRLADHTKRGIRRVARAMRTPRLPNRQR